MFGFAYWCNLPFVVQPSRLRTCRRDARTTKANCTATRVRAGAGTARHTEVDPGCGLSLWRGSPPRVSEIAARESSKSFP